VVAGELYSDDDEVDIGALHRSDGIAVAGTLWASAAALAEASLEVAMARNA
jgi:hypothetical protein